MRPVACLAAAFLLAAAAPPEKKPVSYRITPALQKDGSRVLDVELRLRGDRDGETELFLPSVWAGSSELWRHARDLRIRGARSIGGSYDKPLVRHRPGARLKVRYRIVSAYAGDPGFDYEKARPLVRPDWFFVHGETVFAAPADQERSARFKWGRLPKGWTVASDLDHLGGKTTTVANLINSVAIGGADLKVVRRDLRGAPLRVALLGEWSFTPEQLADTVVPIIGAEDEFWGDKSSPFLIAMAPLGTLPAGLTYHGTGRADAFSIASTSAFELKQAVRFLAHEYMHSWVPVSLGGMPAEEDEPKDYWFSEGFNDYLASKVLLRAGIWTLAEWAADKNETLLRYGTSPAKTANGAEIAARFWTDPAVQKVSYDRGHLLAAKLDSEIAAHSAGKQSLESVLRVQRRAAEGSSELATALFQKVLREQTGIDIDPDLERYARRGEALLLAEDLLGDCARLVTERRKEFHRGYDSEATRRSGGIITGVVPDGPAYAAGMRDGMRLVRRESGTIGDSTVELSYRLADDSGEKVIGYLPEGKGEFEVQRVELTAGPEREASCRARLGGAS